MTDTPRLPGLTLADADWLVRTALEVGAERGFPPPAVAFIDVAGEVITLQRSDGGMPMTSRLAVAKARSALITLRPSRALHQLPSEIVDSIQHLYGGDYIPKAGGVLVVEDGVILGAIAASGALADEDEAVAQAAVERWREQRS